MKAIYKWGTAGVIVRVLLPDAISPIGGAKTGLTIASTGLSIGTIAENEAAGTIYTAAGSTIETITTLGTFSAPTSGKCRFREVDATNFPGLYEIQLAIGRWSVSGARSLIVCVQADGVPPTYSETELTGGQASNNFVGADLGAIGGDTEVAQTFSYSVQAIARGLVSSSSTTSVINTSSLTPTATVTDQFKGRILIFDRATTTAALRGQATDVLASTPGGVLTVTPLTTAPASGDTFGIY